MSKITSTDISEIPKPIMEITPPKKRGRKPNPIPPNSKQCTCCKRHLPHSVFIYHDRAGIEIDHKTCKRCMETRVNYNRIYLQKLNTKGENKLKDIVTCSCGAHITRGSMGIHKYLPSHHNRLLKLKSDENQGVPKVDSSITTDGSIGSIVAGG